MARLFTHFGRALPPIPSGGRRIIIAAMTTELSVAWDADTHWISSLTDARVFARMQSSAAECFGNVSPLGRAQPLSSANPHTRAQAVGALRAGVTPNDGPKWWAAAPPVRNAATAERL